MVFKTDFGIQDKDSGRLRGRQLAVACGCWFTSTGRPIPRLIKFQDENGELQTIQTIQVDYEEEKHYSGIPFHEFDCRIFFHGLWMQVHLLYMKEQNRWLMQIPG